MLKTLACYLLMVLKKTKDTLESVCEGNWPESNGWEWGSKAEVGGQLKRQQLAGTRVVIGKGWEYEGQITGHRETVEAETDKREEKWWFSPFLLRVWENSSVMKTETSEEDAGFVG